jgi:DNA-binding CsgD family transcriptional regulator
LEGPLQLSAASTARALVSAYAGRAHDVRRDFGEAIGPSSRSGSHLLESWTVGAVGFLEVSLGKYQAAAALFEPLLARVLAAPRATEIRVAGFLPDAVEALIQLRRWSEAEPLVAALEGNGRRLDRAWMSAVGARCRGMLLAAQGDLVGGSQFVRQAMEHHDRLAMPFERARTLLLLGQLQRRQRKKDSSVTTIREALAVFEKLDTPLWADRARAELERSSVGRQRGTGLTPSEQRVAELAASGMTTREVAATLFISPKTVEANLARIYRKFGIRSRAELGQHIKPIAR